ncbi:hypothetical protein GCM10010331_44730 [Streptomyces xanthochromogenes]|uniref:hypothetical protein n=1 Tax=Streptomyces xanthochromogenes TaxID=67384 RepID=UPI00167AA2D5|nr:hypothetical protein [Streptomyces xanthochromogenes]GHB52200.1 hypothetical protein GCM10010331_44730 [Streptomyces xanthochromogenes]
MNPEVIAAFLGGGGIASLAAWTKVWQDRRSALREEQRDIREEQESALNQLRRYVRELEELLRFYRESSIDYSVQLREHGIVPQTTARMPPSLILPD